jgi:hypothetical protein
MPQLSPASYGSDTAVSIVNPFNITGQDNAILAFGAAKNGFSFSDSAATCSFQSLFSVSGPITLNGGKLYLQSDLLITNTGSFADLGTIFGQNHAITFAQSATSVSSSTNPSNTRTLALIARVTALQSIFSLDWSYDNKYLAVATTNAAGGSFELHIYSFDGSTLTEVAGANLTNSTTSVRWRPNSYYLAITSQATNHKLSIYLFNPTGNTLTLKNTQNPTGTMNSVAWQGRGTYLAVAGTVLYVYHFNTGTETLDVQYTTTGLSGTVTYDNIHWAPIGNKNDFIVGSDSGALHLYTFTGAAAQQLKLYQLGTAITSLDWAPTSTYMAIGFSGGNIKTYQHTAATNTIGFKATAIIPSTVNSVSWKPDATDLTAGFNSFSGDEHQLFSFNTTSYVGTKMYGIVVPTNVNAVKFSNTSGTYIARADNSTRYLSIYKESSSPFILDNVILYLNGNLALGSPLNFTGNCIINGRSNTITFTGDGAINIGANSNLATSNVTFDFKKAGAFALQGRTSKMSLQDTTLQLDNDITFGDGSLDVYQDVTLTGPHTFFYETAFTSTIHANATMTIANGATFSLGRTRAIRSEPLEWENNTAHLAIDNATLHITNSGLTVKKGNIDIYNQSKFNVDYTDTRYSNTTQALVFGDGTNKANDATIILHGNSTTLELSNGAIVLSPCVTTTMIKFDGQPQLSIDSTASIYYKRPINISNGWLKPTSNVSFYVPSTSYLKLTNTRIDYQDIRSDFTMTGTILNAGHITLDNNNSLIMNRGTNYGKTTIAGTDALFSGLGNISGIITFNRNASLIWDIADIIGENDINLNGCKITITQNTNATPGFTFAGTGTVELGSQTFALGTEPTEWTGNIYWDSNGGVLKFNGDVTLSGIWTFSGNILLDGQGYIIDFDETGTIILERGAQVEFSNLSLYNISRQSPIACSDNNCKIILNYTDMLLNGDYLFDIGSIYVYYDSTIGIIDGLDGVYTFTYASTKTSTIDTEAYFEIRPNTRFSIGRHDSTVTDPEQQPLVFLDPLTSKLILNGGTLHVTSSGMRLTKGTMLIKDSSDIEVDTPKYDYGLIIGDGTLDNDFLLKIDSGAQLNIKMGTIYYQNYRDNRIVFTSPASSIDSFSPSGIWAKTNIWFKDGTIITDNATGVAVGYDPGIIDIQESITRITRGEAPYAAKKVTTHAGIRPYGLINGDTYYVTDGFSVDDVIAKSGTSHFGGPGGFGGTLTVHDQNATLHTELLTPMTCNIPLNGGTLVIASNTSFANDYVITGSGKVQFLGTKLNFGTDETTMTSTIYWQGLTSGAICLNSNTSLSSTWTFGGLMQFNGNGNDLDMSNRGVLTIRPGATLALENISLKGLGSGKGNINFMSDTSTLKLSNVYLELDNNFSTTIGGIIISGPTVVGTKNYNWLLDQKASMTIDGVTFWQDPLDKTSYGKITFGSGPRSKYLSLVSSGTIKTVTNLDLVTQSTADLETQIRTNSNTLLYLDRIDSNAKLFLTKNNSNALLYGNRTNSNAIIKLDRNIRTNSNTQLYCCRTMSNALLLGDRINSNALARGIRNNSNAIINLCRGARATSNTLLYCCRTTSNALITLASNIRATSNSLLYCCRTTSNALISLAVTTSNQFVINNSNAIVKLSVDTRTNSNALLALAVTTSNQFVINNSNAIVKLSVDTRTNSNALLALAVTASNQFVINNSNAIVKLSVDARTSSNAFLYCCRISSNAFNALAVTTSNQFVINNSNAIICLNTQLQTIDHGPANITINTPAYKFSHDLFLSTDHRLSIQNSSIIDGHGHSFYCSSPADGVIDIAPGSTVFFHHITFRNYTDAIFNLGAGSLVVFGDAVHLELLQAQILQQQWTFTGNSEICGIGKELMIDPYAIVVSQNSSLRIHDVALTGLQNTNLSCFDDSSTLILSDADLHLDDNFDFLTGSITFERNVDIVGTNTLTFFSDAPSTIAKDSQLYMSGVTLNFIPSTFNRDLFTMVDQSSRFFIDDCIIKAPYGMRLIDGTLIADHTNIIDNTGGTSNLQSILFGNGNPIHDLSIEVKPGGSLNLVGGRFEYLNS